MGREGRGRHQDRRGEILLLYACDWIDETIWWRDYGGGIQRSWTIGLNVVVICMRGKRRRHHKEERSWSNHVRKEKENRCTSVACMHAQTEGRECSMPALYSSKLRRAFKEEEYTLRAVAIAWENRGVWEAEGCSRPWEELLFTMHINIELRREIREWNHDDYCCWSNGLNEEELYVRIFFAWWGEDEAPPGGEGCMSTWKEKWV